MPTKPALSSWRRDLPEFVSVSVAGAFGGIDRDVTERTPGRVVIAMPDFTADALAHVFAHLARIADAMNGERVGVGEQELAQALFDAARASGYRCPSGAIESEVG
jgi:hypothetical protein